MKRLPLIVAAGLFACAAGFMAWRTFNWISPPGVVEGRLADFRDAVWMPLRAVLNGHNPYDTPRYLALYPDAGQDFPLYTPSHLLFFLPFAAMSLEVARAVHFAITVGLLVYIARLSLRWVGRPGWTETFVVSAALVVSLPGRIILQTGQTTALTAIGVYNAWRFRDRPLVAGAWLALAMFKPVIGVPVALVFVVAHYVKPVVTSVVITVVASIPILIVSIADAGGIGGFIDSLRRNLEYFGNSPAVAPRTGGSSDVASLIARAFDIDISTELWVGVSLTLLVGVLYVVHRCRDVARDLDLMALAIPGLLLVGYQPGYHAILLVPILTWMALGPVRDLRHRWWVVGLLGWMVVSPFATQRFLESLDDGSPFVWLGYPLFTTCLGGVFALMSIDLSSRRASAAGASAIGGASFDPAHQ